MILACLPLLQGAKKWRMRVVMGLFATAKEVRLLSEQLREQRDRVQDLESACKHLRLEWEELYDKVRHQMSRMSKRLPAAESLNDAPPGSEESADQFAELDPVSRSIMLRRARQSIQR